jgi:tryptophanyl-tRNA synthetase
MGFKVTPWEVSGEIDYEKLRREFGAKLIDNKIKNRIKKIAGGLDIFLRRKFVYSHRDLDLVLKDYENGKDFFLYTGRGPSGEMHIGHLVPLIFTKWLQDVFKINLYIQITDDEKFLVKKKNLEEIEKYAEANIRNIAALGFDPERTFIFRDTEFIKNSYRLMLKTSKLINFSAVKAVFGFTNQSNIGLISFPSYQIIPTFFEKKRCLIPCAIDQDPYWRIQRDIAEKLGFYKTAAIYSKFFPSLTGITGKMSASKPETSVYLSDDEKIVRKKIMKYTFSGGQPTIEEHRKKGGNPEVDVAFQWLYILFEPDDKTIEKIREDYRTGKMLTGELKTILVEKINKFLYEHNRKKDKTEKIVEKLKYSGKLAKEMWNKIV